MWDRSEFSSTCFWPDVLVWFKANWRRILNYQN
uniref:Uncharacterized protein n=1 Tax=Anguilla anguilla TaxID=7936 RepID=A0A0E9UBW9_ANGAN